MAEVAAVAAISAAAINAASSVQQRQAARKMADHQARVAENDAVIARQNAEYEEHRQRRKTAKQLSVLRASAAESGVQYEEGSPLFVGGDTSLYGEMDALNLRRNGQIAEG